MSKAVLFFFLIIALCSPCFAQSNQTESLTITTYYPAPYGVYRNLKLHPSDEPTVGVDRGVMYYDDTNDTMRIRTNAGWVNLTGGGGGGNVSDPLQVRRIVVGDINGDGNINTADLPSASRPFYAQGPSGGLTYTGAFVNSNLRGVCLGARDSDAYASVQSTRFVNGQGLGPPIPVELVLNPEGGNVGIGTGNPQEKLDVNGNITATGDICSNGGSNCLNAAAGGIVFTHYCFSLATYGSPVCTNAGGAQGFCPAGYKQKLALGAWGRCGVSIGGGAGTSGWFYLLPPGGACGPSATFNSGTVGSAYVCSQ